MVIAIKIKVADLLGILTGPDRIRVLRDGKELFIGYPYQLPEEYLGEDVKKFRFSPEIKHKEWKERGLLPPMEPEILAKYKFSDLEMKIYYEIHI